MSAGRAFRVGISRDLRGEDGGAVHDLGLELLEAAPGMSWDFLPEHAPELAPETVASFDAIMIWGAGGVSAATLAGADRLRLIARFGMGLDAIDLEACGAHDVLVTVAPEAVTTAVPGGAMAFILALAHRLPEKDRLVREDRWADAFDHVGLGTAGRTLGVIGLGNIGAAVLRMAEPFGFRLLGYDPHSHRHEHLLPAGLQRVELETLLRDSDFVCLACPLTDRTRGLIDRERLALVSPHAYLVNIARGPVVDSRAVAEAVREKRLAGAALDVFESEPLEPDHPLLELGDEVILSPHAIAYTRAAFRSLGVSACEAVLAVAAGEMPSHPVNPEALGHPVGTGTG
jgi:phosphoglycerate dehydrogenase-like enzyme